jgi:hypothetical protein
VGQRIFGLALGYEDLVDHDELRKDPTLAVLAGKLEPVLRSDCEALAGKSTLPCCSDRSPSTRNITVTVSVHRSWRGRCWGFGEIFLLGDEPYYARFGFSAKHTHGLSLPGPYEQRRLLGLALCRRRMSPPVSCAPPAC